MNEYSGSENVNETKMKSNLSEMKKGLKKTRLIILNDSIPDCGKPKNKTEILMKIL
jgi:hypothetical protein